MQSTWRFDLLSHCYEQIPPIPVIISWNWPGFVWCMGRRHGSAEVTAHTESWIPIYNRHYKMNWLTIIWCWPREHGNSFGQLIWPRAKNFFLMESHFERRRQNKDGKYSKTIHKCTIGCKNLSTLQWSPPGKTPSGGYGSLCQGLLCLLRSIEPWMAMAACRKFYKVNSLAVATRISHKYQGPLDDDWW